MNYLMDVNALVALAHVAHPLNTRAELWFSARDSATRFHTCAITEIGFVRVALNARLQPDIAAAKTALAGLLSSNRFTRLGDDHGADLLPAYVRKAAEVTDGHLLILAKHNGAKLATLDTGIPGAELIA